MPDTHQDTPTDKSRAYRRIATEEAFAPVEVLDAYRGLLESGGGDVGFQSLWGYYMLNPSEHTQLLVCRIQDLGDERLGDMAGLGIEHQVLALTSPGLELFEPAQAHELARLTNDRLAAACRAHPERFSALAAAYLQDVDFSVTELERAVVELGLKGLIVNSHANGLYLDDLRFEPLLAKLEQLDVPLYLHPNTPPDRMIGPLLDSGLDGAIYGFGVETGMHLIRLIFSGAFDRHPGLRVIVGHLGEALPFWQFRIDHFHAIQQRSGRYPSRPALELKPSDYLRRNIWITTSGMGWVPAIMFTRQVVGPERVMYAMDYPYQVSAAEVAAQDAMPVSASERRAFFESTACAVFGLTFDSPIAGDEFAEADGKVRA